jgi:arylsulfatase A-like enzyme
VRIALCTVRIALCAVWIALCATGFLFASCSKTYQGRYPHVILISLDTTRADHLGCYGNEHIRTPNIDRLAHEGVLFRAATAAAPTTLASHVSIMTGSYPHTHGVPRNGFTISADNLMLAEVLRKNGFRTAAFLGSFALDRRFGFDRGFDVFDQDFEIGVDRDAYDQDQRRAAAVTDAALRWAGGAEPAPTFLFVHYFDAHEPFDPPPPFDRMYARADGPARAGPAEIDRAVREHQEHALGSALGLQKVITGGLTRELVSGDGGPASTLDHDIEALYAGEISYIDRELGRLLDGLRQKGWLESSLVIVTADHGETFGGEHGDPWNHGLWVYDTTVRVPLIVRRSDALAAREVALPVSTTDIFPTVLELLGIAAPARTEGHSLAPLCDGSVLERGPVYSEATQPPSVESGQAWRNARKPKCVRDGQWKYIRAPYLDLDELYDLEADPAERHNLLPPSADDPRAQSTRETAARLRAELDVWSGRAHPLPSSFDKAQLEDTLRRLNQLGYPGGDGKHDDGH